MPSTYRELAVEVYNLRVQRSVLEEYLGMLSPNHRDRDETTKMIKSIETKLRKIDPEGRVV